MLFPLMFSFLQMQSHFLFSLPILISPQISLSIYTYLYIHTLFCISIILILMCICNIPSCSLITISFLHQKVLIFLEIQSHGTLCAFFFLSLYILFTFLFVLLSLNSHSEACLSSYSSI
jgi:hypothetical protein